MKLFKEENKHLFLFGPKPEPYVIATLKRLEDQEMIICYWSQTNHFPLDCELTYKGIRLRDYLKNNEWQ